ncbi:MAG: asparaginase [Eubacteriales bacterium]|nr:asparaginase [Eubacteriales bacterium]
MLVSEQKILILNTGGTLSSTLTKNGLAPGLGREDILRDLEWVSGNIHIDFEDIYSLDSANIGPEDWKNIAVKVRENYEAYSGIVIIHGTDTMAYTASMLTWMLQNVPIPVVLTGSQLSIEHPVADALENCRLAIQMAASGYPGVFIAFNRKIMLGCKASKVRTMSFDAFESINYPYICKVNSHGMKIEENYIPKIHGKFTVNTEYSDKVMLLKLTPGLDPVVLYSLYEMGYEGVVIEAFGLGGMPFREKNWIKAVYELVEKGMAIVVGTQCRYEGSDLRVYETGRESLACGVMQAKEMTAEAAVTKLMWALGQTKDRDMIDKILQA